MKRGLEDFATGASSASAGKSKAWPEEDSPDGTMDELLAVLGYKVRSSEMAKVAQKLEQLEEVMCSVPGDGLSHLSDTVHYNPSDLSTWVESMLSEIHPSDSDDLTAIPGSAIYSEPKRIKTEPGSCSGSGSGPNLFGVVAARPVVLVDSQENGVRLVHSLMACAEAVHRSDLVLAEALVKQIGYLAATQIGAMRKVATYFAEALARRIYGLYPEARIGNLQIHFYESSPYLKFAHFTANQAILEAFEGKKKVHVIDFGINQGLQWPALMQALALRPGGPPAFRLTGIGPPGSDDSDHLQEVGWKLARLADTIHVEFEYRGFVASSLADLDASMLELRPSEVESVAVNSVFELHKLLARTGAVEKVLSLVKEVKPVIVTVVEQESNHNSPVFLDRFTESLHYYSTMFDSLEGSVGSEDKVMSEVFLGRQICNRGGVRGGGPGGAPRTAGSVAFEVWAGRFCAGSARVERVQAGEHAAGAVRGRGRVQGGGEQRVFDARLANSPAHRHLSLATRRLLTNRTGNFSPVRTGGC